MRNLLKRRLNITRCIQLLVSLLIKSLKIGEKCINVFICSKEYECKDKIGVGCSFSLVFLGLVNRSTRCGTQHIEDRFYVMGVEGKWSNLVSLLFYVMAVMCGFYGWLVFRHIKYKRRYGQNFGVSSYGLHLSVKNVPENLVVILIITTFAEGYSTSSYRELGISLVK